MADGTSKGVKQQARVSTNKVIEGLEKLRGIAPKLSAGERNEVFKAVDESSRKTLEALSAPAGAKKSRFEFTG